MRLSGGELKRPSPRFWPKAGSNFTQIIPDKWLTLPFSKPTARAEGDFMLTKAECRGDSSGWLRGFFPWCSTSAAFLEPNNRLLEGNQNSRYTDTLCYADGEKLDWTPSVLSCALDFQDFHYRTIHWALSKQKKTPHFYLYGMFKDLLFLYIKQHSYQSSVLIEAWKCKWCLLDVFLVFPILNWWCH